MKHSDFLVGDYYSYQKNGFINQTRRKTVGRFDPRVTTTLQFDFPEAKKIPDDVP